MKKLFVSLMLVIAVTATAAVPCWRNYNASCPGDYMYTVENYNGCNWLVHCYKSAEHGHPINFPRAFSTSGTGWGGWATSALVWYYPICDYDCYWYAFDGECENFTTFTYKTLPLELKVDTTQALCNDCD